MGLYLIYKINIVKKSEVKITMQLYPSPFTHMHTTLHPIKYVEIGNLAGGGHSPWYLVIYDDIMLQGPGLNYVKN